MKNLLSVSETADLLGVSVDTIRRWEKRGLIKSSRSDHNYRLFNLNEVRRIHEKTSGSHKGNNYKILKVKKRNSHSVIELFAGAGGTALGFDNAGFRHLLLNEKDNDAVATLRRNKPNWHVVHDDVATLSFKEFNGKTDVIEGGFPCQAFSYAGKKLGLDDARGTLFYEFARAVKEAEPKIAVGENVRGLLNHEDGKTLKGMIGVLQSLGYRVACRVLKAQYFDVPQKRERLLIIAARKDIETPIIFPTEKDYTISLREALAGCPESFGQKYSDAKKRILARVPEGGCWRDLPINVQKAYMMKSFYLGGGKTGMARRLSWDEPSLTLTCNPAQKQTERCHPSETRPLRVREYARIQTFPDSWMFEGSMSSQYRQIGNAVPPNLGYHVAKCVGEMLEGNSDNDTCGVEETLETG